MFTTAPAHHTPPLTGETVVVIGGSAGIGLATARRMRAAGADVIATAASDRPALERFFAELPGPIDDVLVTFGGGPQERPVGALAIDVAANAVARMPRGGTMVLMGDTAVSPAFTAALGVALAPVQVSLRVIAGDAADLAVEAMADPTVAAAADDVDGRRKLVARAA
jgi:NAD(P)-dependent dehydrogenase (short-subunit alcohol dehydrogenase family)